jgi:hypothetical protein
VPPVLQIDLSDPSAVLGVFDFEFQATIVGTPTVTGGLVGKAPFQFMRYEFCFYSFLDTPKPKPIMYEIGGPPINTTFPQYTMSPPSCDNNITYSYELVSKVEDPNNGLLSPFKDPMFGLPDFFKVDAGFQNITIEGNKLHEAWNTYTIRVIMYDSFANITNSDFTFEVTTFIDCTKIKSFPWSVPPPTIVVYEIGQLPLQTFIDPVIDPGSASVPLACGPVSYDMYGTDSTGTQALPLPDFVTYIADNIQFDIFAMNTARAGKAYLTLDVYYTNWKQIKTLYHSKTLITLQLNLPPVIQQPVLVVPKTEPAATPTQSTNTT